MKSIKITRKLLIIKDHHGRIFKITTLDNSKDLKFIMNNQLSRILKTINTNKGINYNPIK